MKNRLEEQVYWGALLHDVGKFWQRSGEAGAGKHQKHSAAFIERWLRDDTVSHIVAHHHKADWRKSQEHSLRHILALLVCEADSLASGERTFDQSMLKKPMESIFNQISINGKPLPADKHYQLPGFLSYKEGRYDFPAAFNPRDAEDKTELKIRNQTGWTGFEYEVSELSGRQEFHDLDPDTLLYLYKKYLWSVPAAYFKNVPDISLYEHSRLTAAIAICLCREVLGDGTGWEQITPEDIENREVNRYILLGGGLSGIQSYLYGIAHKGAMKALKGRSFWLNQVVESMGRHILTQLELPEANLIYSGGGRFILLLPASVGVAGLADIRKDLESRLRKEYEGELGLEFGHVFLNGKQVGSRQISSQWKVLNEEIDKSKKQKLLSQIGPGFFDPDGPGGRVVQCQFTKKDLFHTSQLEKKKPGKEVLGFREWKIEGYHSVFEIMSDEDTGAEPDIENRVVREEQVTGQRLGREIRDNRNVIAYFPRAEFPVLDIERLHFFDTEERMQSVSPDTERIAWLNDEEFLDYPLSQSVKRTWKFYGGDWVLRDKNDQLKDFADLAGEALGIGRLGVLRMDVDNLGQIFSEGFGERATFSRLTQLSTMLDFFFSGYLNRLRELIWTADRGVVEASGLSPSERERLDRENNQEVKHLKDVLQIVYAGGDDLFIVGVWNVLPDVAAWIHTQFRAFTAGNPSFSLSGGISMFRAKYPLYKAAKRAGAAEDRAKGTYYLKDGQTRAEKNALSWFDAVITWDDLPVLAEWVRKLYRWIKEGDERKGKLDRSVLNKLGLIYEEYQAEKRRLVLAGMPEPEADHRARWSKARWRACYALARFGEQNREYQPDITNLHTEIFSAQSTRQDLIQLLHVLVNWTDLLTRENNSTPS